MQILPTDYEGDPSLARDVLAQFWDIHVPAVRTNLGVSRITWRVGERYWLSQSEPARTPALLRQADLLRRLQSFLRSEQIPISVPEIVAADSGDLVVAYRANGWCLTRHLEGRHPDSRDPATYPALAEGLARFHVALRLFAERDVPNAPDGICVKTRKNVDRLHCAPFVPFTEDPGELEVLLRAGKWLSPRLPQMESLPRQLVHGDWTPGNVLFDPSANCLVAVLDFEAIAHDPVHADLGNICSTVLMWSGLDHVKDRIAAVLSAYSSVAGTAVVLDDIHTAMLAHWFCHYWNWRDRFESHGWDRSVRNRLCLRISGVLNFFEAHLDV